jgi:hypothetical protein
MLFADVCSNKCSVDRAVPLYEEHLEKMKRVLSEDHP